MCIGVWLSVDARFHYAGTISMEGMMTPLNLQNGVCNTDVEYDSVFLAKQLCGCITPDTTFSYTACFKPKASCLAYSLKITDPGDPPSEYSKLNRLSVTVAHEAEFAFTAFSSESHLAIHEPLLNDVKDSVNVPV